MLDLDYDMQAVFYCQDFALQLTRVRPGVEDLKFQGIVSLTDVEALEGHAKATSRTLQCPGAVDLRVDDLVQLLEPASQLGLVEGSKFCVLDVPERVNDGADLVVMLGSIRS